MDHTHVWMVDTGQDANTAKSNLWPMSDRVAQPVDLRGSPMPFIREVRQLGVGDRGVIDLRRLAS